MNRLKKLQELGHKEREQQEQFDSRIFCCMSTACIASGAEAALEALEGAVDGLEQGETGSLEVVPTGCTGLCSRGPLLRVETKDQPDIYYADVTPEIAVQVVAETASPNGASKNGLQAHVLPNDLPFFTKQTRVVLTECGAVNPEKLEDYLAHDGYSALARAVNEMTPEEVCDEIIRSGLRGRGGAGFPTGVKWNFVREASDETKYIIANGDEGDPGAYMDRTVMEAAPHRVLEGMLIGAYAVGANYGYFYVRGEYPIAIDRLQRAIRAARRRGILGKSVMGTEFSFNADVRIGAGAFVCGEETALIYSVEGKRGMPRIRPPYPSASGLWGHPTVINNVETLASVPSIISKGAEWYASIGTETSKGTKVFALTGQLNNTGLIEVPMGITLREIVYDIGGGIPNGGEFKAAQTGGPSGGCIPAEYLDTPVDYESLNALGSIMGSGGLVIVDDSTSMPEFAKFFMDFCMDESCGKCVPCRVGTVQIWKLLDKITSGNGVPEDLDKLERLCDMVKSTSLCGLGQSAPNPVLSTLRFFRDEYEELISDNVQPEAAAE
jgi:bidirectional [NiFe] hydrogenase diaphorase subunit